MTHKLIHTPNYLLVVDDSEIKGGEYCVNLQDKGNNIFPFMDMRNIGIDYNKKVIKKIIAHLPLNDSPILEGVDLLPPFSRHQEDGIRSLAREQFPNDGTVESGYLAGGFIEGYNKAKEKYKYTEEDMWEIFVRGMGAVKHEELGTISAKQVFDNYLQSLSQPKMPVGFECEVVECARPMPNIHSKYYLPKTTTDSQGQNVWVGKYIY